MSNVSRETPPVPPQARGVFAERLPLAVEFTELLAGEATVRGLIGPREVSRLWQRHVLNCALVTEVVPDESAVADIGSGAGLPGLVMAIRRPDLRIALVEPLLRRTIFLEQVVERLGLANVEVVRARAEQLHGARTFDVVTSRAVAPLDRLSGWSLPLVRSGGMMLAMKGSSAAVELDAARRTIARLGGEDARVAALGEDVVEPAVTVVRVRKA